MICEKLENFLISSKVGINDNINKGKCYNNGFF